MRARTRWLRAGRIALVGGLAALVMEAAAAYIHFQRSADQGLASAWLAGRLGERLGLATVPEPGTGQTALATGTYAQRFSVLAQYLTARDIPLILIYIPQYPAAATAGREFFSGLCAQRHIAFVDLTEAFRAYPVDWLYQVPKDTHLSVLGHRLVSAALVQALREPTVREAFARRRLPTAAVTVKGPNPRRVDEVRSYAGLPYRVLTNASGFRMSREIDPNTQRLVLALGDSFTFGTTIDNSFVYPTLAERDLDGIAILNAGIPGAGLLEESQYLLGMPGVQALSLVVLQVLDNDLRIGS